MRKIKTTDPILAMQSWLIKTPNRPNGFEYQELMKLSKAELTKEYNKLYGEEAKNVNNL